MTRLQIAASMLVLTAMIVGCPAPTKPKPVFDGGNTIDFVGRSCNVDAECGDLRCDTIRHQCICLSDESCKSQNPEDPPRYCNNYTGLCVTEINGCKSDSECEATEFCDSSIRACRAVKSFCDTTCTRDGECGGAQDNCLTAADGTHFCSKACDLTADCPRGADCSDVNGQKQCVPAQNPL
ncbi:MAG: hypothetical protein ACJ790_18080, partial [Myxococcaceae bacterium]